MRQYYFDGKNIHSTSLKTTKRYIYSKNSVWDNNIGKLYSSRKLAVNAFIKSLESDIRELERNLLNKQKELTKLNKMVDSL